MGCTYDGDVYYIAMQLMDADQPFCCFCRFSELITGLNRAGHVEEVVQLVDEKRFALNSAAAAEYLRALVETKRLSKLAKGGAIE